MPEEILLAQPQTTIVIPPAMTALPEEAQVARRSSVEVLGNWVIDRDLNVVRRRYWGKVAAEGTQYPEA